MTNSFRRALFSMVFYQQKASKNEILKQIGISTNEINYFDFLRVAVLNHQKGNNLNHPTTFKNKSAHFD